MDQSINYNINVYHCIEYIGILVTSYVINDFREWLLAYVLDLTMTGVAQ